MRLIAPAVLLALLAARSLEAQDFQASLRPTLPLGAARDAVGGSRPGLGLSVGWRAAGERTATLRWEGLVRLDADAFPGTDDRNLRRYGAALQMNLFPVRHSGFFVLLAPTLQEVRRKPTTGPVFTDGGFGVQFGVGWELEQPWLHSTAFSYERMDTDTHGAFQALRLDLSVRF